MPVNIRSRRYGCRHVTETKEISSLHRYKMHSIYSRRYAGLRHCARGCAYVHACARASNTRVEDEDRRAGGAGRKRSTLSHSLHDAIHSAGTSWPSLPLILSLSLSHSLPPLFPSLPVSITVHGCRDMGTVASSLSYLDRMTFLAMTSTRRWENLGNTDDLGCRIRGDITEPVNWVRCAPIHSR